MPQGILWPIPEAGSFNVVATKNAPSQANIRAELIRCAANVVYFVWNYCWVKDEKTKAWAPFHLWPDQTDALRIIDHNRFVILLKARQIGMTTLVVCYAVWLLIFTPGSTILIFSKTQREAKDVLKRIKQTIRRLPEWLQPAAYVIDATQQLELTNGSQVITFASRGPGGDSYTASLVIIDEADLIPELNELLEGAEPTVAADGKLILLSRVDKAKPNSPFKMIWRAAVAGLNDFAHKFIAWSSRPGRTQAWYEAQKRSIESRTGALDDLYAQYPASPEEALAPRSLDRRLPIKWVEQCFEQGEPLPIALLPGWMSGLEGVRVYELPVTGRDYIAGIDVALGNPNSDDSVTCILDRLSLRQVAVLVGKHEPGVIAHYGAKLAAWYNRAWINVERNNHGITTVAELRKLRDPSPRVLVGRDNKLGWWTDRLGKSMMYDAVAESLRCGSCIVRDKQTFDQLVSLEIGTLEAPEGEHDDCAVAFALALHGAARPVRKPGIEVIAIDNAPIETPQEPPAASDVGGVEWFESLGEWWARPVRDGQRIDLYSSARREDAEMAMRSAQTLMAMRTPPGPLSENLIDVSVFVKLRDAGWIG